MEELISVIIPSYNREKTIDASVRSALNQAGSFALEVLIVDDGSVDQTRQVVRDIKDPRVRLIEADHQGACAARNRGIRESSGSYIAFLDSDDTWREGKLDIQLKQLKRQNADAVACAFMHHEDEKSFVLPGGDTAEGFISYRQLLKANMISTQTLLGTTECFRQTLFDESFPRMQDWDLVIRLSKNFKLFFSPQVLADVYVQSDSISAKPELGLRAMQKLLWKYKEEYFAQEDLFMHMQAEICRYAALTNNFEAAHTKDLLLECRASLERVSQERDAYRKRYNLVRHPFMSISEIFRKKNHER